FLGRGKCSEATLFKWLSSFGGGGGSGRRGSGLREAVGARMERMEPGWLLSQCQITNGVMTFTATASDETIDVTVGGGNVTVSDHVATDCITAVSGLVSITINAGAGNDTVDARLSPIGVTINGD